MIGYVRKLNTTDISEERVALLLSMCTRLKEGSLIEKVYVSARCKANDPLIHRDHEKHKEPEQYNDATGDMQGNYQMIF